MTFFIIACCDFFFFLTKNWLASNYTIVPFKAILMPPSLFKKSASLKKQRTSFKSFSKAFSKCWCKMSFGSYWGPVSGSNYWFFSSFGASASTIYSGSFIYSANDEPIYVSSSSIFAAFSTIWSSVFSTSSLITVALSDGSCLTDSFTFGTFYSTVSFKFGSVWTTIYS